MGKQIKTLHTDNGTEYINKKIEKQLRDSGIRHQLTVRYTPEQSGRAERMNCSIVEKAKSMLIDATLGKGYWAEAAATAVYVINSKLPSKPNTNVTLEEI